MKATTTRPATLARAVTMAGTIALLDAVATETLATSIRKRSASLRTDTHKALLSALFEAESTKNSRPLQLVCAALDDTTGKQVAAWLARRTCYTMTSKRTGGGKDGTPAVRVVSVAYCGADHIPATAYTMTEQAGRDTLAGLPFWTDSAPKQDAPAFTVKAFMAKLQSTIEAKQLPAAQLRALGNAMATMGADLIASAVPRPLPVTKAKQEAGKPATSAKPAPATGKPATMPRSNRAKPAPLPLSEQLIVAGIAAELAATGTH